MCGCSKTSNATGNSNVIAQNHRKLGFYNAIGFAPGTGFVPTAYDGNDGYDNTIREWFQTKVIDPITTVKNNAIQDVKTSVQTKVVDPFTTFKNDALQGAGGFVGGLFGGGGGASTDFTVPTQPTTAPQSSNIGPIIAYSLGGLALVSLVIVAVVKLRKKGKAA
jgi:hypothetical protein